MAWVLDKAVDLFDEYILAPAIDIAAAGAETLGQAQLDRANAEINGTPRFGDTWEWGESTPTYGGHQPFNVH